MIPLESSLIIGYPSKYPYEYFMPANPVRGGLKQTYKFADLRIPCTLPSNGTNFLTG